MRNIFATLLGSLAVPQDRKLEQGNVRAVHRAIQDLFPGYPAQHCFTTEVIHWTRRFGRSFRLFRRNVPPPPFSVLNNLLRICSLFLSARTGTQAERIEGR